MEVKSDSAKTLNLSDLIVLLSNDKPLSSARSEASSAPYSYTSELYTGSSEVIVLIVLSTRGSVPRGEEVLHSLVQAAETSSASILFVPASQCRS